MNARLGRWISLALFAAYITGTILVIFCGLAQDLDPNHGPAVDLGYHVGQVLFLGPPAAVVLALVGGLCLTVMDTRRAQQHRMSVIRNTYPSAEALVQHLKDNGRFNEQGRLFVRVLNQDYPGWNAPSLITGNP